MCGQQAIVVDISEILEPNVMPPWVRSGKMAEVNEGVCLRHVASWTAPGSENSGPGAPVLRWTAATGHCHFAAFMGLLSASHRIYSLNRNIYVPCFIG